MVNFLAKHFSIRGSNMPCCAAQGVIMTCRNVTREQCARKPELKSDTHMPAVTIVTTGKAMRGVLSPISSEINLP